MRDDGTNRNGVVLLGHDSLSVVHDFDLGRGEGGANVFRDFGGQRGQNRLDLAMTVFNVLLEEIVEVGGLLGGARQLVD